ncbi:hypothetical protein CCP3SC1AL1_760019 [Gammaproteobacteria bacterium]
MSKPALKVPENTSPIYTTIGLERDSIGWYVVTVTTQGNEVIKGERTESDLKAIAIDQFKVKAAAMFTVEK